mmetsp:Transcript_31714/g.87583  ORF Transcript_31714/g.87583 Transcript_31714/m.87583 type:complete len:296 (-) Transcript_31714:787-1674(-)
MPRTMASGVPCLMRWWPISVMLPSPASTRIEWAWIGAHWGCSRMAPSADSTPPVWAMCDRHSGFADRFATRFSPSAMRFVAVSPLAPELVACWMAWRTIGTPWAWKIKFWASVLPSAKVAKQRSPHSCTTEELANACMVVRMTGTVLALWSCSLQSRWPASSARVERPLTATCASFLWDCKACMTAGATPAWIISPACDCASGRNASSACLFTWTSWGKYRMELTSACMPPAFTTLSRCVGFCASAPNALVQCCWTRGSCWKASKFRTMGSTALASCHSWACSGMLEVSAIRRAA